jgi:phosphatidylglycerol:prolipoprotein diacylglycerol transferase
MYPILFEFNGVPIYAHGFFLFAGLLAGTAWLSGEARRRRWPKEEILPITLAAFVGGMIGARVSIAFFNGWETAPVVLDFYRLFDPRIGPGSILGGVAGAYLAGYIASRAIGKAGCACDAFAPAMALAMVIGRFGCFLSGEDGLGFFGFAMFRVTLGMVYAEALVWGTFWEELTELMFVVVVIYMLWVFRNSLLPGFELPDALKFGGLFN